MIPDGETNCLYLADTLSKKHPSFFKQFQQALYRCGITPRILPNTKDIWAVDYMPVQVSKDRFVQFTYNPDYLRNDPEGRATISDVDSICKAIGLKPTKSSILVDGGNVVRTANKVIMCDKVFKENDGIGRLELTRRLENLFQVDEIIFIPTHPLDTFGHADGVVRFLDDDTVLVNDFDEKKEDDPFPLQLRSTLRRQGLEYIEVPSNPYSNTEDDDASGEYLNFLQMKGVIVLPEYGMDEDGKVVKLFEELLQGHTIATVKSNVIAKEGGVLNCVTWKVQTGAGVLSLRC